MIALSFTFAAVSSPAAFALDTGDIVVTSIKGEVHVTVNGAERAMKAGGILETPSAIRTGRDGALEIRQGATSVSVGPDTLLEFPAQEQRGGAIDRIVQPRGNAFYSIGKRAGRKLRVETPYLVGVIKGTQFNVAAQEDSATISLFEGRLEVHATDESDVVDLNAGEIAARKRGAKSITVLKMDKAPTTAPRPPSSTGGTGIAVPAVGTGDVQAVGDVRVDAGADAGTSLAATVNAAANGLDAGLGVNATPPAALDVGVNVGSTGAAMDVSVNVSSPAVDLGTVASLDVTPGAVGLDATTSVGAGPVSADVGVDVGIAAGPTGVAIDTNVVTAVDAGPVAIDVAANTAVDVGASGVSAAVDAGTSAALGASPVVDATTTVAVDVGASTQVAVDTSATVAGVDAGVAAAVNANAGTVDVGVNVAGINVGAAVDLGLDNTTTTTTTTTPVVDVGGLLDGLLRHRRK
jgi:hypothetical protein